MESLTHTLAAEARKVIEEVIIEIARQENVDLVLESGVVWSSDRVNITDKVLKRLR